MKQDRTHKIPRNQIKSAIRAVTRKRRSREQVIARWGGWWPEVLLERKAEIDLQRSVGITTRD